MNDQHKDKTSIERRVAALEGDVQTVKNTLHELLTAPEEDEALHGEITIDDVAASFHEDGAQTIQCAFFGWLIGRKQEDVALAPGAHHELAMRLMAEFVTEWNAFQAKDAALNAQEAHRGIARC